MKIITYRNSQDIDVQFEDGTVVEHIQMSKFKKGQVRNPNFIKNKVLSTTYVANNGQTLHVINFRTLFDVDVQFEDGTVVEHVQFSKVKNGEVRNPEFQKKKILSETYMANNGQTFKAINYKNFYDIDIQFEDGTIVEHVQLSKMRCGEVQNPNCMLKRKDSINEYTILYYLQKYGFRKAKSTEIKSMGFKNMELDCYNPQLKLAIEYDGFYWHKGEKQEERDKRKNALCKNNSINLIRIRELGNLLIDNDNDNVIQYSLPNAHTFNKQFEDLLKKVFADINTRYSINIDTSSVDLERDRKDILKGYWQRYKDKPKAVA